MTKQDFLNAVSKLNEKNYKGFISMYGFITDEELAKDSLCVTCKAWYVLSEGLKMKDDIIMFYQPNLFVSESHGVPVGLNEYDNVAPYQYFGDFDIADTGFQADPNDNVEFQYIDGSGAQICCNSGRQQPNIQFPDDFNFELYYSIQKEMGINRDGNDRHAFYSLDEAYRDERIHQMLPEPYQDKNGCHVGAVGIKVYNRSHLRTIVETMTAQYAGNARQRKI